MISLLNFKKNADSYTVLLMMEKWDTIDMLPTVQRPLSPQNYRVMTNYGVPALGSLAINYATQEQYIYGVDGWSEATPEAVLGILNVIENKTYVPEEGLDGYNKVIVNVPQLDTSDATADAGDILSPKTAYVDGQKVTGTIGLESGSATPKVDEQVISPSAGKYFSSFTVEKTPLVSSVTVTAKTVETTATPTPGFIGFEKALVYPTPSSSKTATPTKSVQNIVPDEGELLSDVTVNAIPDEYIVPTGSQTITTNGTVNVSNLASVVVDVPNKTSEITITENGVYEVKAGEVGYSKITVNVQTSAGE